MKCYCYTCGQPTDYSLTKPRFCSHCGSSFEQATASSPKTTQPPHPKADTPAPKARYSDDDDDDDDVGTDNVRVPKINKLDVDVNVGKKHGEKLGNLLGTAQPGDISQPTTEKPKRMSRKKFLEEFKKEAGTLRQG